MACGGAANILSDSVSPAAERQDKEQRVQHGVVFPNIDVHTVPDLAAEAEEYGWDGVFIPDCINIPGENGLGYDPWIVMAAIAMRTERVRFGTTITPLSRRRPWKVARETVTLDHLSNGRLILPVGLGALDDQGFGNVGEATDRKTRAELLDESLAIIAGLWSGEPFAWQVKHYQVEEMNFVTTPVQQPRIPVWVVGAWPRTQSMRRALQWDGLLPNVINPDGSHGAITPDVIREMAAFVAENREATAPFDIVMEDPTPADDTEAARATAATWADAGVTWLLESFWTAPNDTDTIRRRIHAGPPRVTGDT
jgi:alkanesulfonate monooxygenase SsuD/methylene tetrahydromethanopterin reductase-like flavin-dependent oxidoreductase (luciferase family)